MLQKKLRAFLIHSKRSFLCPLTDKAITITLYPLLCMRAWGKNPRKPFGYQNHVPGEIRHRTDQTPTHTNSSLLEAYAVTPVQDHGNNVMGLSVLNSQCSQSSSYSLHAQYSVTPKHCSPYLNEREGRSQKYDHTKELDTRPHQWGTWTQMSHSSLICSFTAMMSPFVNESLSASSPWGLANLTWPCTVKCVIMLNLLNIKMERSG